jgi:hypothetical protein
MSYVIAKLTEHCWNENDLKADCLFFYFVRAMTSTWTETRLGHVWKRGVNCVLLNFKFFILLLKIFF